MTATAKVFNDKPDVVLDGGGLVTLDGLGARRILYQNTCDPAQVWTTRHCQDQDAPDPDRAAPRLRQRQGVGVARRWMAAARSSSAAAGSG